MKNPKKLPWTVTAGGEEIGYFAHLRDALIIAGTNTGKVTRVGHKGDLWTEGQERVSVTGLPSDLNEAIAIVDGRIEIEEQKAEIRAKYKRDLAALVQSKS
jgi:hypothetical protein